MIQTTALKYSTLKKGFQIKIMGSTLWTYHQSELVQFSSLKLLSSSVHTCIFFVILFFVSICQFNRPNMVCTPFATLPANIGICSQRYLDLHNHYMFSNQKLRALALIINAAPFVISFNYH